MKTSSISKSILFRAFPLTALAFAASLTALAAGGQQAGSREALPSGGAETVDVELKTVPFYAVDGDGEPVFDLTLEELVIRVDGEPATPDTLDRWSAAGPRLDESVGRVAETASGEAPAAQPQERQARHVFLLFDETFTSKNAWQRSQRLAQDVLDRLPDSDRLHLLVHDYSNGLRYLQGPVRGAAGRQELRQNIAALQPGAMFLRSNLERTGLPSLLGSSGKTGVGGQEKNAYEAAGRLARAEYQAAAVSLASDIETLAMSLEQISAPKILMVFSSGIDRAIYFDGTYGFAPGSAPTSYYHGRAPRLAPIRERYEASLEQLAGAGVVPVFVNPENGRTSASDSLHHMSETTGGLFLDGGTLKHLGNRILAASSAYYEAGFYLSRQPALESSSSRIEIDVRRPGVQVYFPNRLRGRQEYSTLTDAQKRFIVVDQAPRGVPTVHVETVHPLGGQLLRHSGKPLVAFAADWPADVQGRKVDLYDVELDVAEGDPKVLRFDLHELAASAEPLRIEKELPRDKAVVWAIVAVERASGDAYVRRLRLEPGS